MIRVIAASMAVVVAFAGVSAAQSTQGPAARQSQIGQNAAIDQGMVEAADKAETAMDAANTAMITGIVSGAGRQVQATPQPPRQERLYGAQPSPLAEQPADGPRPDEALAVDQSDVRGRPPCDSNLPPDQQQAALIALLCTLREESGNALLK